MTLLVYIPVPVATVTGESCAYLAIAFDPNGTVTKVRGFQGKARAQDRTVFETSASSVGTCASDAELSKAVQDWLSEPLVD